MRERLTKAERIRKRADYLRIQNKGRKIPIANFVCFGVFSTGVRTEGPVRGVRLGITVSRRVGGAVVRNRVKRLVREAFRRHKPAFPCGLELVVIARPDAAQVSFPDVERQICEVGRRFSNGGVRLPA